MQIETSADDEGQVLGLRERRRRDTLRSIAQTGLDLLIAKGYEETTPDEIAAASRISRRLFQYFKSRDENPAAWQVGAADSLRDALHNKSMKRALLDTLRSALMKLGAQFDSNAAVVAGRLVRSNAQAPCGQSGEVGPQGVVRLRSVVQSLAAGEQPGTTASRGDGGHWRLSPVDRAMD